MNRLGSFSEDARFSFLMEIYSGSVAETDRQIDSIYRDPDPSSKIYWARFLSHISEEKAIVYLVRLLEEKNPVVFAVAQKAFERNVFDNKWRFLKTLLQSSSDKAKEYAIEKLSQVLIRDALEEILLLLEREEDKFLLPILKALRFFADESGFSTVLKYLSDPREEVRFQATLAMVALYEGEYRYARKPLYKVLEDLSPQIRKAVLWGLRKRSSPRDLKIILAKVQTDPDPGVRQEAILALASYPRFQVIQFLIAVLSEEKEKSVLLKAEGVLLTMPQGLLVESLWKIIKKGGGKLRPKALQVLAEWGWGEERFVRYLLRTLSKTEGIQKQMPLLVSMGFTGNPKFIPCLAAFFQKNSVLGYAAVQSLMKIWKHHPAQVPIQRYLEDASLPPLFKQSILKQILKTGMRQDFLATLRPTFLKLLQDKNLNIRYLSAQVLASVTSEIVLLAVAKAILEEDDPNYSQFLKECIRKHLTKKPAWMGPLLNQYRKDQRAISLFFSVMTEANLFGEDLMLLLLSLLKSPVLFHQSSERMFLKDFLTSLFHQKKLKLELLLQRVEGIPGRDDFCILLGAALKENRALNAAAAVPILREWFPESSFEAQRAILDILSSQSDRATLSFLVSVVCHPERRGLREDATQGLKRLARSLHD